MNQIPNHPVYSKNVLEMLTVANDFCITLRKTDTLKRKDIIEYLTKVSPLLYLKGVLLPEVEVTNPDMNERFFTEEDWESLFNTLFTFFGKDDIFWYSDLDSSDDMIKASIAEQVTDIFQDLQDFLTLYQKNSLDAKENAVKEVLRLFISNWGIKLLRVQQPLHKLYFKALPPQSEIESNAIF